MMRPEHRVLFEPLSVKSVRLRNRIVVPPMVTNRNIVGEDGMTWYRRLAAGGAGLVIVEATRTHRFGTELTPSNLRRLVDAVHAEGAAIAIQLFMGALEKRTSPDELTTEDIALSIERFRQAAAICREAGFDGVEPHGAHGFLLNQFFSPRHNHRTDAYGGDLSRRMRLGLEVVSAVREAVGEQTLLLYRHTPKQRDSYTVEESLEFARKLVERGLDVLDVSPASEDAPADLAEPFKRALPVPIIAVNDMDVHDRAVEALTEKRADLIAIGRGLIADPFWADKTRAGRTNDIIVCEKCNKGCFGNLRKGLPIECVQHAQAA